jgi:hypothetical protein
MKIESIDSKSSFVIKDDSTDFLKVFYKKWFSSQAQTDLNGIELTIKPKDFWQCKFDILKNGIDKGYIVFNWKGFIIISSEDKIGDSKEWIVKTKGLRDYRFEVFSSHEKLTLILKPNFNWNHFKYNYEIKIVERDIPENEILELILYSCFGTNLYKAKRDKIAV